MNSGTKKSIETMLAAQDLILFGGTGDLSIRKLLPALFRCDLDGRLHVDTRIFILSRAKNEADLHQRLHARLEERLEKGEFTEPQWQSFLKRFEVLALDITQQNEQWLEFAQTLQTFKHERIFYLAIPPKLFVPACESLAQNDLIEANSKVVLEKPLGYDLSSAEDINKSVASLFQENNIFRIDHYLGKETVQNLLALRFSNVLFETLWDRKSVDHVQITIAESVGLEGRAGFYDRAGAVRDMVQNHLLQLLCLIAMEPPDTMQADSIRQEKTKVLKALRPMAGPAVDESVVRGQYVGGGLNGDWAPGYLEELQNVDSSTETFVAIRAYIDNWRWKGVPFYLRTGKRLARRFAEIVVQFQPVPHEVYPESSGRLDPNRLVIRLQPDEKIELFLMSKALNESDMRLIPVKLDMNFSGSDAPCPSTSDGYKRMLLDVMEGNPSLFIHRDEVERAWRWIDPILAHWASSKSKPALYRAGSYGPEASDELLQETGHEWFDDET